LIQTNPERFMILSSATRALGDIFSPAIRSVFWKVLGLTIVALVALWLAVRESFLYWVMPWIEPYLPGLPDWAGWLGTVAAFIWALGLAAGVAMLIAPVSAIMAAFFLDDAADAIENNQYAADPPGTPLPLVESLLASLRFFLIVIVANIVALFFLLVPGVNVIIFFVVNGYLLGREYFEFAASRHLGVQGARDFRSRNQGTVTLAGLLIALFLFVPVLNLLTPLFAAVTMVHLFKALRGRQTAVR
jgi:CysZ protein